MGIHPYGLFGTNESNTPFGSDYELRRQLAARQAQLNALNKRESLSDNELKQKDQLTNAVNHLSSKINKAAGTNPTASISSSSDSRSNSISTKGTTPATQSDSIPPEGRVVVKSPSGSAIPSSGSHASTMPASGDHLKGFFLDLKI